MTFWRAIRVPAMAFALLVAAQQQGCDQPGTLEVQPASVDVGIVLVGTDGEARVSLRASRGPVEFFGPGTMDGGDAANFQPVSFPRASELAAGARESFAIRFRPERAGPHQSTYQFQLASGTAQPLAVSGRGVWSFDTGDLSTVGAIPAGGHDFGDVCVNQHRDWAMVVQNTGTQNRRVVAELSWAAFRFRVQPFLSQEIPAGGRVTYTVRYSPTSVTADAAGVTVSLFSGGREHRTGAVVKGRGVEC